MVVLHSRWRNNGAPQHKNFIGLTAVEAAPPSRTVTLAPGKNPREVALVNKAAELGNIRKLLAWVLQKFSAGG
jgi:hypothetical protein